MKRQLRLKKNEYGSWGWWGKSGVEEYWLGWAETMTVREALREFRCCVAIFEEKVGSA